MADHVRARRSDSKVSVLRFAEVAGCQGRSEVFRAATEAPGVSGLQIWLCGPVKPVREP